MNITQLFSLASFWIILLIAIIVTGCLVYSITQKRAELLIEAINKSSYSKAESQIRSELSEHLRKSKLMRDDALKTITEYQFKASTLDDRVAKLTSKISSDEAYYSELMKSNANRLHQVERLKIQKANLKEENKALKAILST